MHLRLFLTLLILLACSRALADARSYSTDNEWNSPAISGTGGIGSLSSDHTDLFFSDPSLLAEDNRRFVLQFLNLHVGYAQDLAQTVSDVTNVKPDSGSNGSSDAQLVDMLQKLRSVFGRRMNGMANVSIFSLKVGGLSLIPYSSITFKGEARTPDWPTLSATADVYGGVGIGYALSLNKNLDLGVNVRPGYRYYLVASAGASLLGGDLGGSSSSTSTQDIVKKGGGIYVPLDVAFGFNPNQMWRFSLVIRDLGGADNFSYSDTSPPVYPMRINLGTTVHVFDQKQHRVSIVTELQDLLKIQEENGVLKRWQWGGQYRYTVGARKVPTFALNVGMQSGYPSGGFLVDLFFAKAEMAMYYVEAGEYPGQNPEKRVSLKLVSELTF